MGGGGMLPAAVQSGSSASRSFPPTSMPVGNPQQPMYFSDLATACKDNGQFDHAQRIDEAVVAIKATKETRSIALAAKWPCNRMPQS